MGPLKIYSFPKQCGPWTIRALVESSRREEDAVSGFLPLSGGVRIQHPGSLHPCPNCVHPRPDGFLFQTTPTPLDALLNPKHDKIALPLSVYRVSQNQFSLITGKKKAGVGVRWCWVRVDASDSVSVYFKPREKYEKSPKTSYWNPGAS